MGNQFSKFERMDLCEALQVTAALGRAAGQGVRVDLPLNALHSMKQPMPPPQSLGEAVQREFGPGPLQPVKLKNLDRCLQLHHGYQLWCR